VPSNRDLRYWYGWFEHRSEEEELDIKGPSREVKLGEEE
jgi:hypothetical protein